MCYSELVRRLPLPRRLNLVPLYLLTAVVSTTTASQPMISNVTISGGNPTLSITSALGATNQIQTATNLNQSVWVVLTNIVVAQSPYSFVDTLSNEGDR